MGHGFRNHATGQVEEIWYFLSGAGPLEFVLVTMPPRPGAEEAVRVPDYWPTAP